MTAERRRLLIGTSWTFVSTVVSLIIGAVLRPVIVSFVGLDGYGVWATALAVGSLVGLGGDFGVASALTRKIAGANTTGRATPTLVESALLFGVVSGIGFGSLLAVLSRTLEKMIGFPGLGLLLIVLAIQMPFNFGITSLLAVLQGKRDFRALALLGISQATLSFTLSLLLLAAGYGVFGVLVGSLVASIGVFGFLLVSRRQNLHFAGTLGMKRDLTWLIPFGLQLTASNLLAVFMNQVDIVILSLWSAEASTVGTYALAIFITRLLWIVPSSVGVTTYPVVSEYSSASQEWRVGAYLSFALNASVAITGILGTGIVLFGRPILRLLFGQTAVASYPLTLMLLPGIAAVGSLRSIAGSIASIGRPDVGVKIAAISAVVIVSLCVGLTMVLGSTGTAIAVSISFALLSVLLVSAVVRHVLSGDYRLLNLRRVVVGALVSIAGGAVCVVAAVSENPGVVSVLIATGIWAGIWAVLWIVSGGMLTWGTLLRRPGRRRNDS